MAQRKVRCTQHEAAGQTTYKLGAVRHPRAAHCAHACTHAPSSSPAVAAMGYMSAAAALLVRISDSVPVAMYRDETMATCCGFGWR